MDSGQLSTIEVKCQLGRALDVAFIQLGMPTGLKNAFHLNLKYLPSPIRLWYNPFPEHMDMHVRALSVPGLQSVA